MHLVHLSQKSSTVACSHTNISFKTYIFFLGLSNEISRVSNDCHAMARLALLQKFKVQMHTQNFVKGF